MVDHLASNTRMKELEGEIDKLKLENVKLNSTVEELNAQILSESGRVLMSSSMNKSDSFAAEIGTVTKDKDENEDKNVRPLTFISFLLNLRLNFFL